MLEADSVQKRFTARSGELDVLRDVTFSLAAGEAAVIMGPSGSGKSTLLNILGTLEPCTAGTVTIDGTNPFTLAERELARFRNHRVGFVFQDHHLLPQCCVSENVLLPALAHAGGPDRNERANNLLDRVGLSDRLDHLPGELSGGERQRVAIARALINEPALVLADEPTGNLDQNTADAVADLLTDLPNQENAALIVVTHSPRLAERFARRYDLTDGVLTSRPTQS